MLHKIQAIDTSLFLWLNGFHTPWLDKIMYWVTERNTWIPIYILLIIWLIWRYKQRAAGIIGLLILTILIADQTASTLLKPWVERLRPCYVSYLQDKIHLVVEGCGGKYGFASSHASNSFGLATALWLLVLKHFRYKKLWRTITFVWAIIVAYSRVYVGVHYPLDIVAGALIGVAAAYIAIWIGQKVGF